MPKKKNANVEYIPASGSVVFNQTGRADFDRSLRPIQIEEPESKATSVQSSSLLPLRKRRQLLSVVYLLEAKEIE